MIDTGCPPWCEVGLGPSGPAAFLAWAAAVYAPGTVRLSSSAMTSLRLLGGLPVCCATPTTVDAWWQHLGRRSVQTRASYLLGVRRYYRWRAARRPADLDPTRHVRLPAVPRGVPRPVPAADVQRLLRVLDGDVRVWVGLAALVGLRRSEIAALRPRDVHHDPDGHLWLRIHGKGGRIRMVPLAPPAAQLMAGYRWPAVHPATVGRRIGAAMRAAGVDGTAHQLRHTCATQVLAADRDPTAVQALLGHANLTTTMVYAQVHTDRVRQAVTAAFGSWVA